VSRTPAAGVFLALLCLETSCLKYQPHELNPVLTEQQFHARSLDTPGLAEFVRAQRGTTANIAKLDPETLTYIGYFFSPALEVARAKAAAAETALVTARQRPNPSLTADGGYNRTPDSVATYSVSMAFTIETAGKRGYRILEAQKLAEASRIAVYEAAWQVRSSIGKALLAYWSASRTQELLRAENALRTEIVGIYQKRVDVGEAATPELSAARSDQVALAVNVLNAENEVTKAMAAIAQASGLPLAVLQNKSLDVSAFSKIAPPDSLPVLQVQRAGLLHRADIRRTLLEYEAADAGLRLALANQYPNIVLNPAYAFQEGFPAYTLGSVLESLPVFHRNQGPIAEREAARRVIEAQFKALQAQIVGNTEAAWLEYRAAAGEWLEEHDALLKVHRQREALVLSAFRAGERDRLDVAQARLMTLVAQKEELDALLRAHNALSVLEDAVQAPLDAGVPAPRPEMTN
jgi:cobalt-zinc-cadmium efflux system outer membrane protein